MQHEHGVFFRGVSTGPGGRSAVRQAKTVAHMDSSSHSTYDVVERRECYPVIGALGGPSLCEHGNATIGSIEVSATHGWQSWHRIRIARVRSHRP